MLENSMNLVYELRGHKGKKYCACTQLAILSIHFIRNFVIKTTCPSACIWPYCLVGLVPLYCRPRYSGILDSYYSGISLSHSLWYFDIWCTNTNHKLSTRLFCIVFFSLLYGAVVSHRVKINKIIYLHPLKPHLMSGKAQHWNLVVKCSVLFVSRDKREHNSSIYQYTRYVALVLIHSCSVLCKLTSYNYLLKASCMLIKRYSSAIQSNSIVFFYLCLKPYEEMNIILPFSNHEAERILCRWLVKIFVNNR